MPGNYSVFHVWSAGDVLTASDLNGGFTNEVNNAIPASIGGDSANVAGMQATQATGGVGSESLATSLQGEIERLRYTILQLKQLLNSSIAQWYQSLPGLRTVAPEADNLYNLGSVSVRFANIYGVNIVAGDIEMANGWKITEDGSNLAFVNPKGVKVVVLNRKGLFRRHQK